MKLLATRGERVECKHSHRIVLVAFSILAQQKKRKTLTLILFVSFVFSIFISDRWECGKSLFISVNTIFKDIVQIFRVALVLF